MSKITKDLYLAAIITLFINYVVILSIVVMLGNICTPKLLLLISAGVNSIAIVSLWAIISEEHDKPVNRKYYG